MIAVIALIDWWTLPYVSLGLLYLFPMMLMAGFLPRWAVCTLGIICALLSEMFSSLDPTWRSSRLILESMTFAGGGLFVSELIRSRRLNLAAQQRLRALVETSPAAVLTVNRDGIIELSNDAAISLLTPNRSDLLGQPIDCFIPALKNVLQPQRGTCFRTSLECQGRRDNGEPFVAEVWFSTYKDKGDLKLAAIIADVSEEEPGIPTALSLESNGATRPRLNRRQLAVLRLLLEGLPNHEIAARLQTTGSSVKNILHQLFLKTGARNRSQMVRVALERYRDLL